MPGRIIGRKRRKRRRLLAITSLIVTIIAVGAFAYTDTPEELPYTNPDEGTEEFGVVPEGSEVLEDDPLEEDEEPTIDDNSSFGDAKTTPIFNNWGTWGTGIDWEVREPVNWEWVEGSGYRYNSSSLENGYPGNNDLISEEINGLFGWKIIMNRTEEIKSLDFWWTFHHATIPIFNAGSGQTYIKASDYTTMRISTYKQGYGWDNILRVTLSSSTYNPTDGSESYNTVEYKVSDDYIGPISIELNSQGLLINGDVIGTPDEMVYKNIEKIIFGSHQMIREPFPEGYDNFYIEEFWLIELDEIPAQAQTSTFLYTGIIIGLVVVLAFVATRKDTDDVDECPPGEYYDKEQNICIKT